MTPDDMPKGKASDELQQQLEEQIAADSIPGVSNVAPPQHILPEKNTHNDSSQILNRTHLHELINEAWGYGQLDNPALRSLIKYVDADMAKKEHAGFSVSLLNGGKIEWTQPTERNPYERISCSPKEFCPEAAASIIAMARLRGWKKLNLTGTPEQKEIMWLEAQRQNLKDYEQYLEMKDQGLLPKNEKGEEVAYQPLTVTNFEPLEDSLVYQTWLRELQDWQMTHLPAPMVKDGSLDKAPEPEKKADEKKPEDAKNPEAEKKSESKTDVEAEAETKPEKKPAPEKKPEPVQKKDAKVGSKFIKSPQQNGNSRFMQKPNTKPHNTIKVVHKSRNRTNKPR